MYFVLVIIAGCKSTALPEEPAFVEVVTKFRADAGETPPLVLATQDPLRR